MNRNIVLVTHTDLDGVGCAVVGKKLFKDELKKIYYIGYDEIDKKIDHILKTKKDMSHLFITDACPSKEIMAVLDEWKNVSNVERHVMLFDHHKTTITNYDWVKHSLEFCATVLFERWAIQHACSTISDDEIDSIFPFVKAVDAWDMWKLNSEYREMGSDLDILLSYMSYSEFINALLDNPNFANSDKAKSMLSILKNTKEKILTKTLKIEKNSPIYTDVLGKKFKIMSGVEYISDLGNRALIEFDLDYVVIVGGNSVSLRSKGDVDVSVLAKSLGGGGHKNASGFVIGNKVREFVKRILDEKVAEYGNQMLAEKSS
jgi:oligoribonuclease NrnB/cAMP/cGMP phosphodiesterase (DHH superfamily)